MDDISELNVKVTLTCDTKFWKSSSFTHYLPVSNIPYLFCFITFILKSECYSSFCYQLLQVSDKLRISKSFISFQSVRKLYATPLWRLHLTDMLALIFLLSRATNPNHLTSGFHMNIFCIIFVYQSSSTLFTRTGTVRLLFLPNSGHWGSHNSVTMKHSGKGIVRTASEIGKNMRWVCFEAKSSILRNVNGNVFFIIITF